jgi:tRNA-splicing ligase RtcB
MSSDRLSTSRETDLAHLAGFFDGEGNVGIYAGGGTGRTLRAQITQNRSTAVDVLFAALRSEYGGSLCELNKDHRRRAWIYQASGDGAARMLSDVLPYLRLKSNQVDLALLWFASRPVLRRDAGTGVAEHLKAMKKDIDVVMKDADDLVEIRHTLRQIINVKGD